MPAMSRFRPFWQLVLARVREFYREPAVIFWVHGFPLFLALGLGVAFSGGQPGSPEVALREPPKVAIANASHEHQVGYLVQTLEAGGLKVAVADPEECQRRLRVGKIALFVVPTDGGLEYHYDPHRPDGLVARYRVDDLIQRAHAGSAVIEVRDQPTSEPGNRYIDFLIPGLMGLNLMGGGLWGVGFVIVELRVRKLLKFFLATPMYRSDFLLAILTSRLLFIVPEMLLLVLAGVFLFGVPIRGNLVTLVLVILVGGAAFSGMGLLIASRTEKTQVASGLINLCMLPMWMISGTFFSYDRFPQALHPWIKALPLTQLNDALRAVMLEGAGLGEVAVGLVIIAAWGVMSFLIALRLFRWL
jgi:ABC-type multidrug transport system permease subunit